MKKDVWCIRRTDARGRVTYYKTLKAAARSVRGVHKGIQQVLQGRNKHYKGYGWEKVKLSDVPLWQRAAWGEDVGDKRKDTDQSEPATNRTSYKSDGEDILFEGEWQQHIETLEEALEYCNVDLDVYEVKNWEFSHWTTPMKTKQLITEDGEVVEPNVAFRGKRVEWRHVTHKIRNTRVWVAFSPHKSTLRQLKEELLKSIPRVSIDLSKKPKTTSEKPLNVEVCIFDLHLGKSGFDAQSMKLLWSPEMASDIYTNVSTDVLRRVDPDRVDTFVLPFGNDLLHVDGTLGKTFNGTKLTSDGVWFPLFQYAKDMLIQQALLFAQYGKVLLIPVGGNHDYDSILSLGEVLAEKFRDHPDITVQSTGGQRQYHQWGTSMVAYMHGDKIPPQRAKDMIISDVPHMVSDTTQKFVHLGHEHRSIKKQYITLETVREELGVEVEYIPSLCPTDYWHSFHLFIGNLRRAKTFVYHKDYGQTDQFIHNLNQLLS